MMAKWVIKGSLIGAPLESADPLFVSEPFLTEEGAKSFAMLLTKKGYAIAVQIDDEAGQVRTIAGAELVRWLNSC